MTKSNIGTDPFHRLLTFHFIFQLTGKTDVQCNSICDKEIIGYKSLVEIGSESGEENQLVGPKFDDVAIIM